MFLSLVFEVASSFYILRHPEILKDRDLSGELKDVWNAVQALRDKQRAENHYATQENLVLYTEFGPESAPPMYQQQQQQRETVIQYSGQSAITNTNNGMQTSADDANSLKDHMEKISSETENMRISPTEPTTTNTNKGESNESMQHDTAPTTLPINNQPASVSSPTSVIVSTGNVTVVNGVSAQPSPTNHKKDSSGHNHSSSSSFLTKFRSSKTSQNHHNQQDHPDAITVQDVVNNKKDSDHAEHHQQSKHKKFLSYIRRKAGTKNDNYTNRENSRKGMNGDNNTSSANTTPISNHNGNNEDNTNSSTDIGKQEIIEAPIIDAK